MAAALGHRPRPQQLAARSFLEPTLANSPPALPAELANYNELCKLSNSQQYRHMFLP